MLEPIGYARTIHTGASSFRKMCKRMIREDTLSNAAFQMRKDTLIQQYISQQIRRLNDQPQPQSQGLCRQPTAEL